MASGLFGKCEMYWLRTTYLSWTKKQGIELSKDDLKFIENILIKLPEKAHKSIMRDYSMKWLEGVGEAEKVYQEQNFGRRMANLWLRETLDTLYKENFK